MEIELPEGWRLGKVAFSPTLDCNQVTLFYKNVWSDKLVADESLASSVKAAIDCPSSRVYPVLFKDGKLDFSRHKSDKGIWKLIELGYITPKQGYDILPTANFVRTAKRKGVWVEAWANKSNYVHYNSRTYARKGNRWYDITDGEDVLLSRPVFKSVWDARVSLANERCSLVEVAEYSLGAVLECVADIVSFNPNNGRRIYQQVVRMLETASKHPVLRGFTKKAEWEPIFSFQAPLNSTRWADFLHQLKLVCRLDVSGYEARLHYTNGYDVTIKLEHNRFMKAKKKVRRRQGNARLLHVPFLRHLDATLGCLSLSGARDYLQKKYSELFSIGPYTEKNRLVFFRYSGYGYGLWVDSGKLFRVAFNPGCWSIPFGYDRIPVLERRRLLGSSFDLLDEAWCNQSRKARRSYFYFTRVLHFSSRRARFIVKCKHLRTNYKKLDYEELMDKYSCAAVNKTAISITINWKSERRVA